ncbi:hypothetical protein ABPG72_010021 [Tetrahymena utriculariae]
MEKIEYRSYIKQRTILGIKAIDIHRELEQIHGINAPHYSTVANLAKQFREGRVDVEDLDRIGRPQTARIEDNIQQVQEAIEVNPHATYDELEELIGISRGTLQNIIHQDLQLRKVASRYVPHILNQQNKKLRLQYCNENLQYYRDGPGRLCDIITGDEVQIYWRQIGRKISNSSWVGQGEPPRTIVKRSIYDQKTLFSIFFRSTGYMIIHAPDDNKTRFDSQYYIQNCLTPVVEVLNESRPTSGTKRIKLLHDNAKPHKNKEVDNFLQQNGIGLVPHPPYSPDLSPCDFWLNDQIKRKLNDHSSFDSLFDEVTRILEEIPTCEYKKTFECWIERLQLCIDNQGDYFEHKYK